jgi:hypothetical protein
MSVRTISGLGEIAAREVALMEVIAGICGDWIAEERTSTLRPLWADIAQSHAWYRQLWSQRFPVIPGHDLNSANDPEINFPIADLIAQTRSLLDAADDDQSRLRTVTTVTIPATLSRIEAISTALLRDLDRPTAVITDRIQMDLNRLLYTASQV